MKSIPLAVALLLLLVLPSWAQDSEAMAEAKLKAKIDDTGLKFSVTETGNYKFVFGLDNDRSQLVIVRKKLTTFFGTDYIYLYSPTMKYTSVDQIPRKVLLDLMNKNGTYKLGWFELVSDESGSSNVFYISYKLPLTATTVSLYALMKEVAMAADKTEQLYTTQDQY